MRSKPTRYLLFLLPLLFLAPRAHGQEIIFNYFNITSEGADVLLEWELQNEDDITKFNLYRKFNDEGVFTFIGSLNPNGSLRYQFLDDDIFKNNSRVIQYELHVVTQEKTHKFPKSLLHSPTSIQRTWGSIKSMFR